MATPNDGQTIVAAWEAYVSQDPVDNIFDHYGLLQSLAVGESFEQQHGRSIFAALEFATNSNVASISELETINTNRDTLFDQAEYAWKFTAGSAPMSEFETAMTESGGGKFNLRARKIANLRRTMEDNINAQLFSDGTGNSSKDAGGFQHLIPDDPTTGTVGQINAASFSFWRSQQTSGAKSSTAFDNLLSTGRSIYNLCSVGNGFEQTPTDTVTTRTVFEGFEGLLTSNERYIRRTPQDKGITGFKGNQLMFKDVNVFYDNDCPSGNWYFYNRRNLTIAYMRWMKMFPPASPVNQFIDVVKVLSIFNLVSDNRRRLGVVTGIT